MFPPALRHVAHRVPYICRARSIAFFPISSRKSLQALSFFICNLVWKICNPVFAVVILSEMLCNLVFAIAKDMYFSYICHWNPKTILYDYYYHYPAIIRCCATSTAHCRTSLAQHSSKWRASTEKRCHCAGGTPQSGAHSSELPTMPSIIVKETVITDKRFLWHINAILNVTALSVPNVEKTPPSTWSWTPLTRRESSTGASIAAGPSTTKWQYDTIQAMAHR